MGARQLYLLDVLDGEQLIHVEAMFSDCWSLKKKPNLKLPKGNLDVATVFEDTDFG